MKTNADFKKTGDSPSDSNASLGWIGDPAEDFQKSRLARAVAADDSDDLSSFDLEIDVAQGPKLLSPGTVVPRPRSHPGQRCPNGVLNHVTQSISLSPVAANDVALRQVFNRDDLIACHN